MITAGLAWTSHSEAALTLSRSARIESPEYREEALMHGDLDRQLRYAAPAVISPQSACGGIAFLALERVRGNFATLLTPQGPRRRIRLEALVRLLSASAEAPFEGEVDAMLDRCGVSQRQRESARRALLRERVSDLPACRATHIRTHPGSSFPAQLKQSGVSGRLLALVAAHLADYGLWLVSWVAIGMAALNGRTDQGGTGAWILLLAALIPVRLWASWSQGVIAMGAGGLLKQRILTGALALGPDALRAESAGQMLGRTIEAEAMEGQALIGGLDSALALGELCAAAVVLYIGAGIAFVALLALWTAVTLGLAFGYSQRRLAWTRSRLALTEDLVERMNGHRTRLTQEPPEHRHLEEDAPMADYAMLSRRMDRLGALMLSGIARGWELIAFAALMPLWVRAQGNTSSFAISIGGVLLAGQSFRRLAGGLAPLIGAAIAWGQVKTLFQAARNRGMEGTNAQSGGGAILETSDLTFRHSDKGEPCLKNVTLRVDRGDRLLLEGPSGSGKSTLASLLAGLRQPCSGMLLAGGLDLCSAGERAWRKRIAAAPQFHDNHVLAATFAFNLLMGRAWPPAEADLSEAEAVCRELGLGPLIDRMPGGLNQLVGETGWQLSQGEKSRLFMARALLQGGDLTVLDEAFAALDPVTLRLCLDCVLRRARTLILISHY